MACQRDGACGEIAATLKKYSERPKEGHAKHSSNRRLGLYIGLGGFTAAVLFLSYRQALKQPPYGP